MEKMFDPVIDKDDMEWCYAAKSTTVVGLPFVLEPVQVTYDGAVYTRYAELCFFHDADLQPVMARNKTFAEGWMPIVQYAWKSDSGVDYSLEIFSAELPGMGLENLTQFVRLSMENATDAELEGTVAAAARLIAPHFRKGDPHAAVTPETEFEMSDNALWRDGKLIFAYSDGAAEFAVPDEPYKGAFKAAEHLVSYRSETGLVVYRKRLAPGETFSAFLKMPRVPVDSEEIVAEIKRADYDVERAKTAEFWNGLLGRTEFLVPEKRVNDTIKTSMVHLILATRTRNGKRMQGSGLPYDDLFLNDYMDMMMAYERFGLDAFVDPNVDWLLGKQYHSGMFIDYHNRGNDDIVTSHGQGLFALAYKYVVTRDKEYGEKVYPAVRKGVEFIINDHLNHNEHGILRPSIPYDAPMVMGYHSCHNLHALAAMRVGIRMADMLGEKEDAERWREMEKSYRKAVLAALEDSYEKNGYVTSGLFDWKAGNIQDNPEMGKNEYPNQDWENNLLLYPTELYPLDSKIVRDTVDTIRRRKYREGCMTYRNGQHVHQYITINQAHQYMLMGDGEKAILDYYHVLLHNGSTHEGFENLVEPWTNRTPYEECPPPHAWAAAKIALFSRNMLVLEYGGELGANPEERELFLFSLISPAWVEPGKSVEIRNAPTEMGAVSAEMTFTENGCRVSISPDFHSPPAAIRVGKPYFVDIVKCSSDAGAPETRGGFLWFPPETREIEIEWRVVEVRFDGVFQKILKMYRSEYPEVADGDYAKAVSGEPFLLEDERNLPPDPPSFELVRKAFLKEYSRRFAEFAAAGNEPYEVAPPEMLRTPEERKPFFGTEPPKKNMYWEDNVEMAAE